MAIERNLQTIQRQIAKAAALAGRDAQAVSLLAVTKTVKSLQIKELVSLGISDLGENRVQDATKKQDELREYLKGANQQAKWHLIGSLQTNKARTAVERFDFIHSLDRWRLAVELNNRVLATKKRPEILIQVNVSGEETKHGLAPGEALDFYEESSKLPGLRLCGLMTMAPMTPNPEEVRPVFARLRQLFQEVQEKFHPGEDWRHLSMGMSNDFQVAIQEGATIIRIGTAIFDPLEEELP